MSIAVCTGLFLSMIPPIAGMTGEPPEWSFCNGDVTSEVTLFPTWSTPGRTAPAPSAETDIPPQYVLVDQIARPVFVPAGTEYSVMVDYSEGELVETLPCTLTENAQSALLAAPAWVRRDLEWNLGLLDAANQDRYADLILSITDETIVDEVAFQVAHLSWTLLANTSWDEQLLVNNAQLIYEIDPGLQYVEVRDYPSSPDGQYTTTAYQVIEAGDTVTVEIPREIYYWWIVMPKVSDERPLQDSTVYGYFWREYLYWFHDDGYPDMLEVMAPLTVLWDGTPKNQSLSDPFTADMQAVEAVSLWEWKTVPEAAWGNRPIQPNIIAHEHNGNCGETQDLLCAAARTCLIPTACTMDILEDHVWCEMWWDGEWHPWQPDWLDNPYIAYDYEYGGFKEISCIWDWRNDGWTWTCSGTYSESSTLSVHVEDSLGVPVDNALVSIGSEGYFSGTVGRGSWGETDHNGDIEFVLGDSQNYYVSVSSTLGVWPSSGYSLIISDSETGQHYYWEHRTAGFMPVLDVTELPSGSTGLYVVQVEYDLPWDLMNGRDFGASPYSRYAEHVTPGSLDFFIASDAEMDGYLAGEPFDAYEVLQGLPSGSAEFYIPSPADHHVVFSGHGHQGFATLAEVTISLYADQTGISGQGTSGAASLGVSPNPAISGACIEFDSAGLGEVSIRVYDLCGREAALVYSGVPPAGPNSLPWDLRGSGGTILPPGIYIVRMETAGETASARLAILR